MVQVITEYTVIIPGSRDNLITSEMTMPGTVQIFYMYMLYYCINMMKVVVLTAWILGGGGMWNM